jgi:hypothetical protein
VAEATLLAIAPATEVIGTPGIAPAIAPKKAAVSSSAR